MSVSGGTAYVAAGRPAGLQVVDVRDPAAPRLVGTVDIPGFARRVTVADDLAHVGTWSGLQLVDVSGTGAPRLVGIIETPGSPGRVEVVGDLVFVADGFMGLEIVRPNPAVDLETWNSDSSMEVTIPAGFTPGPYDLRLTNGEPESSILHNAFRACLRREWSADLEPVLPSATNRSPLGAVQGGPLPWRLAVDGDESFFAAEGDHEAFLWLPDLPEDLEVRFEAATGPMAFELRLAPERGLGELLLVGPTRTETEALWNRIRETDGIALPALDREHYGDLEVSRLPAFGASVRRYRYEFADGVLTAASFSGRDADLTFRAVATDDIRCEFETSISFVEAAREACERLAGEHPGLRVACARQGRRGR